MDIRKDIDLAAKICSDFDFGNPIFNQHPPSVLQIVNYNDIDGQSVNLMDTQAKRLSNKFFRSVNETNNSQECSSKSVNLGLAEKVYTSMSVIDKLSSEERSVTFMSIKLKIPPTDPRTLLLNQILPLWMKQLSVIFCFLIFGVHPSLHIYKSH